MSDLFLLDEESDSLSLAREVEAALSEDLPSAGDLGHLSEAVEDAGDLPILTAETPLVPRKRAPRPHGAALSNATSSGTLSSAMSPSATSTEGIIVPIYPPSMHPNAHSLVTLAAASPVLPPPSSVPPGAPLAPLVTVCPPRISPSAESVVGRLMKRVPDSKSCVVVWEAGDMKELPSIPLGTCGFPGCVTVHTQWAVRKQCYYSHFKHHACTFLSCEARFHTRDQLEEHLAEVHKDSIAPQECPHCSELVHGGTSEYAAHIDGHKRELEKMHVAFVCSWCHVVLHQEDILEHLSTKHMVVTIGEAARAIKFPDQVPDQVLGTDLRSLRHRKSDALSSSSSSLPSPLLSLPKRRREDEPTPLLPADPSPPFGASPGDQGQEESQQTSKPHGEESKEEKRLDDSGAAEKPRQAPMPRLHQSTLARVMQKTRSPSNMGPPPQKRLKTMTEEKKTPKAATSKKVQVRRVKRQSVRRTEIKSYFCTACCKDWARKMWAVNHEKECAKRKSLLPKEENFVVYLQTSDQSHEWKARIASCRERKGDVQLLLDQLAQHRVADD